MLEYKLEAQTKQRQMSRTSLPASTHLGERVVPMRSQGALLLISYTVVNGSKIVHFCRSLRYFECLEVVSCRLFAKGGGQFLLTSHQDPQDEI